MKMEHRILSQPSVQILFRLLRDWETQGMENYKGGGTSPCSSLSKMKPGGASGVAPPGSFAATSSQNQKSVWEQGLFNGSSKSNALSAPCTDFDSMLEGSCHLIGMQGLLYSVAWSSVAVQSQRLCFAHQSTAQALAGFKTIAAGQQKFPYITSSS